MRMFRLSIVPRVPHSDCLPPLTFGLPAPSEAPEQSPSRFVKSSFSQFRLSPEIQLAVAHSGMLVPTSAQLYGIPKLMAGDNLLLISQTGKGKTLAYLLPLVDKLIRTNAERLYPQAQKPRAIVVVPTRELAVQTLEVVRKVFGSSITSLGLAPGLLSFVKEKRILSSTGADLLITTPSRLQLHMKNPSGLKLSNVQSLVLDEADTLCDSVYEAEVRSLMKSLLSRPNSQCQFAIVGATKTAAVNAFISSIPGLNLSPVVTTDAHMTVPHLDQVFIPVGRRKRTSCLTEVLAEQSTPNAKTLVFTNSVRTCNYVSKFLRENEVANATSFHGEIPHKIRAANYKKFADPNSGVNLLVCTNLASRGIDLDSVNHVVMYDFPHTLADYIHRAGRTARAGRLGRVTALFTKGNLPLARKIQEAAKLGKPIEYKQAVAPARRAVQLDKYRAALDELKTKRRGKSVRGLRAVMGLPPHLGLGSVEKRAVANEWKKDESAKKEIEFLRKRKRLGKNQTLPRLPDRGVEASETRSASKLVRNGRTGDLQFVTARRRSGDNTFRSARP